MGCDIHMLAEKKNKDKWEKVGNVFEHKWGDKVSVLEEPYGGRNYELFAFLAGVRNRFDIKPISEPKGFAEDASEEVKKDLYDYWDGDGHSASYFTLEELKNADWDQEFSNGGVVSADVYDYLKNINETPKYYSQGISGPNVIQLTEEQYEKLTWEERTSGTRWYVYMYWKTKIKDECQDFINNTIPSLEKLGEPKDVRILFLFDN